MARPSSYNPSYIKVAEDYIASCNREATELATIEGLALRIGVDTDTIDNWCVDFPEFFGAIKNLKASQKNQLINDGLYGGKEVNQAMAIFLLKANHGMVETTRTEVGGVLNANGEREPIRLLVNAGQGFVPANISLQPVSTGGNAANEPEIQGTNLAPQGAQNLHSNNGNSQAGTP